MALVQPIRLRALPRIPPVDGRQTEFQVSDTHIQWRYGPATGVDASAWVDLISIEDITGPIGPNVELRNNGEYIQWSPEGEDDWTNLVSLVDITGPQGLPGADTGRFIRARVVDATGASPSTAYEAGDTVDGVTLVAGDIILRATSGGNASDGLYVASASGAASRFSEFATYDDHPGTFVSVMEGATYADSLWQCTSNLGGTLSSTAITFIRIDLSGSLAVVTSRTNLKALDTTLVTRALLTEAGREGVFLWRSGNYASLITADGQEGVYVKANAIASSSGAWVRVYNGALDINWFGADKTGSADSYAALLGAKGLNLPIYAPKGEYKIGTSVALADNFHFYGDGIDETVLVFQAVEGFQMNDGAAHVNIKMHDFTMKQSGNWGGNTLTALFLSNVSYSYFDRIKIMYFQYGVYMRRTNPGSGYLACYFNFFDQVHTFGCQYGFTAIDNGGTVNKCSFTRCKSEDNGQRSGGYGIDIDGVGHSVHDFYGGLPGHTAAVRLRSASLNCTLIDIYGESATLTQVIKDSTGTGRNNVIIGVHADGVSTLVTRDTPTSNAIYINAGDATNVNATRTATQSRTPPSVGNDAYDYITITTTGIAVGDDCEVIPPSGWQNGLIRGKPVISSGSVNLPYVNKSGGSLTPPSGTYTVKWKDYT